MVSIRRSQTVQNKMQREEKPASDINKFPKLKKKSSSEFDKTAISKKNTEYVIAKLFDEKRYREHVDKTTLKDADSTVPEIDETMALSSQPSSVETSRHEGLCDTLSHSFTLSETTISKKIEEYKMGIFSDEMLYREHVDQTSLKYADSTEPEIDEIMALSSQPSSVETSRHEGHCDTLSHSFTFSETTITKITAEYVIAIPLDEMHYREHVDKSFLKYADSIVSEIDEIMALSSQLSSVETSRHEGLCDTLSHSFILRALKHKLENLLKEKGEIDKFISKESLFNDLIFFHQIPDSSEKQQLKISAPLVCRPPSSQSSLLQLVLFILRIQTSIHPVSNDTTSTQLARVEQIQFDIYITDNGKAASLNPFLNYMKDAMSTSLDMKMQSDEGSSVAISKEEKEADPYFFSLEDIVILVQEEFSEGAFHTVKEVVRTLLGGLRDAALLAIAQVVPFKCSRNVVVHALDSLADKLMAFFGKKCQWCALMKSLTRSQYDFNFKLITVRSQILQHQITWKKNLVNNILL